MSRQHPPPPQRASRLPRQWERAVQSLEDSLYRNTEHPNTTLIRRLREVMFADVDEYQASGKLKLPE